MNRFIKKNLFLVGVLALTAVIVVVLLVLSVMQTIKMERHSSETEKMRDTNRKLMRKQPPAVQENMELVQRDIDGYRVTGEAMKQFFGQTLNPALQAFCDKIKVDKEAFTSRFRSFWDKVRENGGPREQTYRRFRTTCCTDSEEEDGEKALCSFDAWDEALEAFVAKAQPTTMEKIDEQNREEIFLSSLGLPRTLNAERRLEVFINTMQTNVTELLEKNKVSAEGVFFTDDGGGISELKTNEDFDDQGRRESQATETNGIPGEGKAARKVTKTTKRSSKKSLDDRPGGMGMNEMGGMGSQSDEEEVKPSDVVRNWEIMSDLARRMSDAKLESLEKLSYGPLTGKQNGCCTFYTYEFTVRGSQKAIRNFMNSLGLAYQENRVYVIRNLAFRKLEDQTQDLIDVAQGILAPAAQEDESELSVDAGMPDRPDRSGRNSNKRSTNRSTGSRSTGSRSANSFDNAPMLNNEMSKKAVVQDYFTEQNVYGEIVIGRSDQCEASFTVDYVVYTANILN